MFLTLLRSHFNPRLGWAKVNLESGPKNIHACKHKLYCFSYCKLEEMKEKWVKTVFVIFIVSSSIIPVEQKSSSLLPGAEVTSSSLVFVSSVYPTTKPTTVGVPGKKFFLIRRMFSTLFKADSAATLKIITLTKLLLKYLVELIKIIRERKWKL